MNKPPRYERSIEDTAQEKRLKTQAQLRLDIAAIKDGMNKVIIWKDVVIGFFLAVGLMALLWWWLI